MENNTIFISGMFLNKVSDKAPDFIITNQSIHMETLYNWLKENKHLANEKGYINITGKESKGGKRYFQLDTYEKKEVEQPAQASSTPAVEGRGMEDITAAFTGAATNPQDIPF